MSFRNVKIHSRKFIQSCQIRRIVACNFSSRWLHWFCLHGIVSNYISVTWLEETNVSDNWLVTIIYPKGKAAGYSFVGAEIAFRSGLCEWAFPLASSRVIPHKGKWSVYPRDYERTIPLLAAVHLFRTLISFLLFSRNPRFFVIFQSFGNRMDVVIL